RRRVDPGGASAAARGARQPAAVSVGGMDGGAGTAVPPGRVQQEPAEAAADVDHALPGLEPNLAADVLDLVALSFLDRARTFLPVRAGVHEEVPVEPELVEVGAERVVEAGVGPGLLDRAVREAELVPAVAHVHDRVAARVGEA